MFQELTLTLIGVSDGLHAQDDCILPKEHRHPNLGALTQEMVVVKRSRNDPSEKRIPEVHNEAYNYNHSPTALIRIKKSGPTVNIFQSFYQFSCRVGKIIFCFEKRT